MQYWYVITILVILYLDTRNYMQLTKSWLHTPFSGQNAAKFQIFTFMCLCVHQTSPVWLLHWTQRGQYLLPHLMKTTVYWCAAAIPAYHHAVILLSGRVLNVFQRTTSIPSSRIFPSRIYFCTNSSKKSSPLCYCSRRKTETPVILLKV